jgi:hypothetical protein
MALTSVATPPGHGTGPERWRRPLLACGILAAVLYVAMTLCVGLWWEGYSIVSGVPSELSAIGAPTRQLWIWLGAVYAVLMVGFGWIVWRSAPPNRALRVVGALLIAHTVFGQFWPPMHQRAVLAAGGGTLTDTLHLVWAAVTAVFFMFIVGCGAAALGRRFRVYSIATMVIVLACGAVTGTYASQIQADLPTPGVGVWERISIATFMAWIVVLATALLRAPTPQRLPIVGARSSHDHDRCHRQQGRRGGIAESRRCRARQGSVQPRPAPWLRCPKGDSTEQRSAP